MTGKIIGIAGPTVRTDLAGLKLYEKVQVGHGRLTGEVVKLEGNEAVIQVYEESRGLAINEPVLGLGTPLAVTLGPGMLSEIFDGLQRPLTALRAKTGPLLKTGVALPALDPDRKWLFIPAKKLGAPVQSRELIGFIAEGRIQHHLLVPAGVQGSISWLADPVPQPLSAPCCRVNSNIDLYARHDWPVRMPRPFRRKLPPGAPIVTGQRIIDFLFPLARGGTAILPGGFGTGKTILEQSIAKFADVDIVIYAGCGERGNEIAELIEEFLALRDPRTGRFLMERTILVVNTSNMPVAAREASIYTAVALAEYYRDLGLDVLLLADSISRWAEALREISAALEEMPGEEGYPTYLASRLAVFIERAGIVETMGGKTGSLSMILTVSPPGGDFTEPVTQALLSTTGAFLMLDTKLAHGRHFPALNWTQSYSLYEQAMAAHFQNVIAPAWQTLRTRCRDILRRAAALQEILEIVGFEGLQESDRLLIAVAEEIRTRFLAQNAYSEDAFCPPAKTLALIEAIIAGHDRAAAKIAADRQQSRGAA